VSAIRGRGGMARHGKLNGIFRSCGGSGNRQGGESGEISRANSAGVAGSCGDSEVGWCGGVQGCGSRSAGLLSIPTDFPSDVECGFRAPVRCLVPPKSFCTQIS